jgi:hypothetical protein
VSRLASYVRRHHVALLALFVALGGTSFAAVKSIVGRDGVIHGCYARKSGALRIVAPSRRCKRGESKVAWNHDGRPGVRGVAGPVGPTGPTGADAPLAAVAAHASIGSSTLTAANPSVSADLVGAGGTGRIVTSFPSRLVIHATADFSKPSADAGLQEAVGCRIRLDSGSGFDEIGTPADVTLPQITTNNPVHGHSSPAASADVPAGSYDVSLTCTRSAADSDSGSQATMSGADLDAVAVVRKP